MSSAADQDQNSLPNPNNSRANAMLSSPSMFSKFAKLPVAVREQIWRIVAEEPRTVSVSRNARSQRKYCIASLTTSTPPPALLHATREARIEGLKIYRLLKNRACDYKPASEVTTTKDEGEALIYFNFDKDVLYFRPASKCGPYMYTPSTSSCESLMVIPGILRSQELPIHRLAMNYREMCLCPSHKRVKKPCWMGQLKRIDVVASRNCNTPILPTDNLVTFNSRLERASFYSAKRKRYEIESRCRVFKRMESDWVAPEVRKVLPERLVTRERTKHHKQCWSMIERFGCQCPF